LHFLDYLPFEEDLALYLNNLEFPLIKIGLLVQTYVNIVFSIVAPPDPGLFIPSD
jgi:hypothetical protein